MHSTAVKFAIRHKLPLGRYHNGYYFLVNRETGEHSSVSMFPTAKSAIVMMRRHLEHYRLKQ